MVKASKYFVPVFVDTLKDLKTTRRFKEHWGSYPVLRVHDHREKDLAGRIDGNKVQGRIPSKELLAQLKLGQRTFLKNKKKKESEPKKKSNHEVVKGGGNVHP